jgi:hypothetical protein
MPIINAQNQVFAASDYKILLVTANNYAANIVTAQALSMDSKRESESVNAIGQEQPIANKRNAASYEGTLEIQVGELLSLLAGAGYKTADEIADATLSIVSINVPPFSRVYRNVNINSENIDIKAKDKSTTAKVTWVATTVE